jgi:N-methylhydantoinase A/oxoprolinase/acetone carboxylase beta subunit
VTLSLGIDTGGTFTDAVVMEEVEGRPRLLAKAKAPTTHDDLAVGVGEAIGAVLDQADCDPKAIGLVSLSTTLATNALVEGRGERVALVSIGFGEGDMHRAGLAETLGSDPLVTLPGGHDTHGREVKALDLSALDGQDFSGVKGIAVAGLFATRNPTHENAVRQALVAQTDLPVTCSHDLSPRLNGPKRALTTVLNARLVPMIGALLVAVRSVLEERNIAAPLMVVRGDGALVSADFAAGRPIETILSGPAASLVGARFLTGMDNALVVDIGGTTSDAAVLAEGRPIIDPDGAFVGGHRTMVEAVAMQTHGLGGDSAVTFALDGLKLRIALGPARHVPISRLAARFPQIHQHLDKQLATGLGRREDGLFVWQRRNDGHMADPAADRLLQRLGAEPQPVSAVLEGQAEHAALQRLFTRGLVGLASITPTDAAHMLGLHAPDDVAAAQKALDLMARRKGADGLRVAVNGGELAARILETVERRSAEIALQSAFLRDGQTDGLVDNDLVQQVLDGPGVEALARPSITLSVPIIGLGASAYLHHPKAARRLGTHAEIPTHADVANAIGAVVGQVVQRAERVISRPEEGRFVLSGESQVFADEKAAFASAEQAVREEAEALARDAGASEIVVRVICQERRAKIEGRDTLVEATITATATGRPSFKAQSVGKRAGNQP